jgi:hypothetical protein
MAHLAMCDISLGVLLRLIGFTLDRVIALRIELATALGIILDLFRRLL